MPDYSACMNHDCERKESCCRYLMVPNEWQAHIVVSGDGRDCDLYWPLDQGAPFRLKEPADA